MSFFMENPKPHFVVVPLMAQGHMIPMADLSLLLASRGARVSLITTPANVPRLRAAADLAASSNLPLRVVPLPFPCSDAGLPPGCENVDLVRHQDLYPSFFKALNLLAEPLKHYLRAEVLPSPTCIIADQCMPWTMEVAGELGIPRFVFHGPSCFFLLCTFKLSQHNFYERVIDERESFIVPELPERVVVEVSKLTAQRFFDFPGLDMIRRHVEQGEAAADGVVLNTFDELEPWCLEEYQRAVGKTVWPVGPVSGFHTDPSGKAVRGGSGDYGYGVVEWLEGRCREQKQGSVMFASFGSITRTRVKQMVEIGLGLEAAGRAFIWAVKEAEKSEEGERWMAEFEERTKGMGMVIRGWAPQAVILSHPAVGGFMTHCGWNSTVEAVAAGVVMVTWPHLVDQFLNERLVVDVLGIGVRVGVKWPAFYQWEGEGEGEGEVVVGRKEVREAVERVMDGGEEGEERRKRARELGAKARKAMEKGGSSSENLNRLIENAMNLAVTEKR